MPVNQQATLVSTPAGWFFCPVASFGETAIDDARPHAEEHRSARGRLLQQPPLRCDASRSMRANSIARSHPSRRAHALSTLRKRLRMRAPQDEDGRARGSSPNRFGHSDLTMSNSPSRSRGACLRPGFATLLHSPRMRGGRSAEKRSGAAAPVRHAMTRRTRRLARRLASHDAGRSPLGAPPWRFWAPGPRFSHRHSRRIGYSELLAPRS
jgi:hypothetical protein